MKYRIKQIDDKFYPERKRLLFWKRIALTGSEIHWFRIEIQQSLANAYTRTRGAIQSNMILWSCRWAEPYFDSFRAAKYFIFKYQEMLDDKKSKAKQQANQQLKKPFIRTYPVIIK